MDRMLRQDQSDIVAWTPQESWRELTKNSRSYLVDVRTRPEWQFVGLPDLSTTGRSLICVEWNVYPSMQVNPSFMVDVVAAFSDEWPETLLFICRSGARSEAAARAFREFARESGQELLCVNVAEGFEGDLDDNLHRGDRNGWKQNALPWRQS